ncbi:MAG: TIGR03960 family B12-binding radical SAM protein [Candidatus Nanopelagicales bacterium]
MVQSVWPQLEAVLPLVSKPVQYLGGEVNTSAKPWDEAQVHWALFYPDLYEVGAPNQGMAILYEVLNELPGVLAQRAFSPNTDLAELMRQRGIPAFTVDGHVPLRAFDLLGVSMTTELGYTNLLEQLHLAGIPLLAAERTDADPLVILGGHAAFNPEPLADFIDVAVLGDGEQAVGALSRLVATYAAANPGYRAGRWNRVKLLEKIAISGIGYVPAFYDVSYRPDGRIAAVQPNRAGVPARVAKHVLTDLDAWPYPKRPIVPLGETVHERLSVEIFRGCTRGCRFCQAGMITRPVRERSAAKLGEIIDRGLRASGFEEVGLLSLSSADHTEIGALSKGLADRYEGSNVSLSLPSTRVDAFNIDLAKELSRNGRRSGLTFAPEGGSERMRSVINKMVTEADLISTVTAAYGAGWRNVKLYFMCGLPTETDDDVLQIAALAREVIRAGRRAAGRRDIGCTVSIGGFVPKPHTPFQWAAQLGHEEVDRRIRALREAVRADRECGRAINIRWADGRPGLIEGLLSRGDRRLGAVILAAWQAGARFDGWREHFSYDRWVQATATGLAGQPVDLDWFTTRERAADEVLPWDHLDGGLEREWLWDEWQQALAGQSGAEMPDCRWSPCNDCGVCDSLEVDIEIGPGGPVLLPPPVVRSSVLAGDPA